LLQYQCGKPRADIEDMEDCEIWCAHFFPSPFFCHSPRSCLQTRRDPAQTGSSRHGGRLDERDENSIAFDFDAPASPNALSIADLADWQANFGTASLMATHGAVPVPSTWMLLSLAVMGSEVSSRRRIAQLVRIQ
jgi:hypothetical protein